MRKVKVGWELAAMCGGLSVLAVTDLLGMERLTGYSLVFLIYLVPVIICSIVVRSIVSLGDAARS